MADFQGRLSPCSEDFEEEALDPRIQVHSKVPTTSDALQSKHLH